MSDLVRTSDSEWVQAALDHGEVIEDQTLHLDKTLHFTVRHVTNGGRIRGCRITYQIIDGGPAVHFDKSYVDASAGIIEGVADSYLINIERPGG